jgi:glycerol-3-phosphate dehydrogenase
MKTADLDLRDRTRLFAALEADVFDVAVIGGGITGAGIARDAAMRGLSVALVEARDFAAGTSSRSSKLVHGGIRYLAQGDMALVREAALERKTVRQIAPHLARRTLFIVPAHSRASIAKFRTGLWTYEKLGSVEADDRHELWNTERLASEEPALDTTSVSGAIVYPEYVTDDARLTLANIRSAASHGATVANYAEVTGVECANGVARALIVTDTLTAESRSGDRSHARLRARVIVNATGPWADHIRQLERADADKRLALSKGIHLVVSRARLSVNHTVTMTAADKRGVFVVPRGDVAYLGTTDTFYPDSAYWPTITAADVDYLLAAANRVFRTPALTRGDVIALWSGIRPLIAEPGNKSPSELSRRDEVMESPAGIVTIAGGKLTAYRRMAERIADLCVNRLGRNGPPSTTAEETLPGGDLPESLASMTQRLIVAGLEPGAADRLLMLYGAEALTLTDGVADEARHAVLKEGALTLEDYWVRRSARARFDVDAGLAALQPAADAMAPLLGWSPAECARQVEACRAIQRAERASLDRHD